MPGSYVVGISCTGVKEVKEESNKYLIYVFEVTWSGDSKTAKELSSEELATFRTQLKDEIFRNRSEISIPEVPAGKLSGFLTSATKKTEKRKKMMDEFCAEIIKLPDEPGKREAISSRFSSGDRRTSFASEGAHEVKNDALSGYADIESFESKTGKERKSPTEEMTSEYAEVQPKWVNYKSNLNYVEVEIVDGARRQPKEDKSPLYAEVVLLRSSQRPDWLIQPAEESDEEKDAYANDVQSPVPPMYACPSKPQAPPRPGSSKLHTPTDLPPSDPNASVYAFPSKPQTPQHPPIPPVPKVPLYATPSKPLPSPGLPPPVPEIPKDGLPNAEVTEKTQVSTPEFAVEMTDGIEAAQNNPDHRASEEHRTQPNTLFDAAMTSNFPNGTLVPLPPNFNPEPCPASSDLKLDKKKLPKDDSGNIYVIAVSGWKSKGENTISFKRRQRALLLYGGETWWFVSTGEALGWVPSTYWRIITDSKVISGKPPSPLSPWSHGVLGRPESEALLAKGADLDFLVREGAQPSNHLVLSILHKGEVRHFGINRSNDASFFIGNHHFRTLHNVVIYYRRHVIYNDSTGSGFRLGRLFPKTSN